MLEGRGTWDNGWGVGLSRRSYKNKERKNGDRDSASPGPEDGSGA